MILCVTFGKLFGLGLFLCLLSWKTGLKKKKEEAGADQKPDAEPELSLSR